MLKRFLSWPLKLMRRMLGTAQIIERLEQTDARNEQRYFRQSQMTIALGNAVSYSRVDAAQLRALPVYQRASQMVRLLSPMDIDGGAFARFGRPNDGGYVMVDNFSGDTVDAAYSFGVGREASWDFAIADRGIDVLMFDHTIDRSPISHPRCHHIRVGVRGARLDDRRRTLDELIQERGHAGSRRLILKVNIDGAEWDVFDQAPSASLERFAQMVIEFHRLTAAAHDERSLARIVRVLDKINHTHQSVHVHANTNMPRPPVWIGSLVLPDALAVTYIRRADVAGRLRKCQRVFPTSLDQPSHGAAPGLHLGNFQLDDELRIPSA
jgi:hypothetical protein